MGTRLLTLSEVLKDDFRKSKATLHRHIIAGKFPKPLDLDGTPVWREEEVAEWKATAAVEQFARFIGLTDTLSANTELLLIDKQMVKIQGNVDAFKKALANVPTGSSFYEITNKLLQEQIRLLNENRHSCPDKPDARRVENIGGSP